MRQSLSDVTPYRAKAQAGLNLADNTNLLGPNPALGRLDDLLERQDLNAYPDNDTTALRQALSQLHDLPPDSFLIANGSNEAYDLIVKTFLNPGDSLAFVDPSFSMYPHYAKANAVHPHPVALDHAFDLDVENVSGANSPLTILCTPNNPTGNALDAERIKTILESGRRVVIDEAYGEFADYCWLPMTKKYPNLIVTRTLSKAYGLAGLRVGYITAQPDTLNLILRARLPFNVNSLSLAIACAALKERDFLNHTVTLVNQQRASWSQKLEQLGFRVWPSQANFVLAEVPKGVNRRRLIEQLRARKVIVRSCGHHLRLSNALRITIGMAEHAETFFGALGEVLP